MGRNSMKVSGSIGGVTTYDRVTALHGRVRPLRFDLEVFETLFAGVANLLEGSGLQVELGNVNTGLPTALLTVTDENGDTYKLSGMHTMGFYFCIRGDGKIYKLTEQRPKVVVRKIKQYFVI